MIIGITGTNGAGKGTVPEYLAKRYGYTHYSVRDAIVEEIIRRGLEVNRTNMNEVATDLRRTHGAAHFAPFFMERAKEDGIENAVIESIRNPLESRYIQAHAGIMLLVDADIHLRFDRIQKRKSATDQVSFEEFVAQEEREMVSEDPSDPSYMDIRTVMKEADVTLMNEGTLDELYAKVDAIVAGFPS